MTNLEPTGYGTNGKPHSIERGTNACRFPHRGEHFFGNEGAVGKRSIIAATGVASQAACAGGRLIPECPAQKLPSYMEPAEHNKNKAVPLVENYKECPQ